ncbi:hypothetical protein MMC16_006279 [Acarospora aff. strigata]|nr:hypothetical protein [Acarospora aff. strigata]
MADGSPTSMSAAAQAYQDSIHKYQQRERSVPAVSQPPSMATPDVVMADSAQSPAAQAPSSTSTPAHQRTATPTRAVNGNAEPLATPNKAAPNGARARRYLNDKVTGVLLEGMKKLSLEQSVSSTVHGSE